MKYVKIEEPIQIKLNDKPLEEADGSVAPSWPISKYLEAEVLCHPTIGSGHKAIKSCDLVAKQFKDATPGDCVAVEDAHWELLRSAIESDQAVSTHPIILRQLLPFMDAILEAASTDPEA